MPVTAVRDEGALRMWVCRLPVHIGPLGSYEFAEDYRKIGAICRVDVGIDPYEAFTRNAKNFEQFFKFRGKDPRKLGRFSWSIQGTPGENRNPPGLVFFSQSFLLEKQKKRLRGSRRFSRRIPTLICVPLTTKRHEFAFVFRRLPLPAAAVQVLRANDFVCKSGLDKGGVLCYDALG